MSAVIPQLEPVRAFIHKNPAVKKYADMIEEKTTVRIEFFAIAFMLITLFMLYHGYFGKTIANLVGFVYPVYGTILALEKDKSESGFWLTYWIVFSLFNILDLFLDALLWWVPYFYPLKTVFILCLYLPQTNGAQVIFDKVVQPAFKAVEQTMDDVTK